MTKSWAKNDGEYEPLLDDTFDSPSSGHTPTVPTTVKDAKPISALKKLGFAWGGPPNQLTHTLIGFQLNFFLLVIVQLQPRVVGAIVLSGRFWDGLMDPTVGMMTTRTRSRWGSLKPWIAGSIVPLGLSYLAIWSVPPFYSDSARAAFVTAGYLMYQLCISMYYVPYTSLTVHLSSIPRDLDSATMYRMIAETMAVMIAAILTKVIVPFSEKFAEHCKGRELEGECVYSSVQLAYMAQAAIISVLCAMSGIGVLMSISEQKCPPGGHAPPASFWSGLVTVLRTPSFRYLTIMFVWIWMGVAVIQANFLLFATVVLEMDMSVASNLILIQIGVSILSEPFWFLLMVKFGKKNTFIAALAMTIPMIFGLYFLDENTPMWQLELVWAIFGVSIAAVYLVPAAMTPDVINQAALREGGTRKESLFYSYGVLFQKFAAGIALFVSNEVLESIGDYDSAKANNDQAKPALRWLMSIVPGVFGILSLLFALCYPLTPQLEKEIKEKLDRLQDGRMAESAVMPPPTNGDDDFKPLKGEGAFHAEGPKKPASVWDGVVDGPADSVVDLGSDIDETDT